MRRTRTCIALALLTVVVTACGDSDDDGADDAAADCSPASSTLTVGALDELRFDAESYDAGAGCIEVTYDNEGTVAHTLLVDGVSGFKLAVGDTDTGTIELDAGEYTLYCDVAGHQAAGMDATLTVS
jgi:plastocyanin